MGLRPWCAQEPARICETFVNCNLVRSQALYPDGDGLPHLLLLLLPKHSMTFHCISRLASKCHTASVRLVSGHHGGLDCWYFFRWCIWALCIGRFHQVSTLMDSSGWSRSHLLTHEHPKAKPNSTCWFAMMSLGSVRCLYNLYTVRHRADWNLTNAMIVKLNEAPCRGSDSIRPSECLKCHADWERCQLVGYEPKPWALQILSTPISAGQRVSV